MAQKTVEKKSITAKKTAKVSTAKAAKAGKTTKTKASSKASAAKKSGKDKNKEEKSIGKNLKGLIIVESPAKARTLEKFSGGSYVVRASMGHVRDLPKTSLGVDTEQNYEPHYITIRGKKGVIDELKKNAKRAESILLASDPDREGEAIAWHLANILKVEEPKRIEMHEITRTAFDEALNHPRSINMNLVDAQQARRVLDRLVGYNLSPLLWRKISGGLSAGRVQSVAVKMICDRQSEIDEFIPVEYWSMEVLASKLKQQKKDAFELSLIKENDKKIEIPNKEKADAILKEIKKKDFIVDDIKKKESKKNPAPPFKTSTLQQDAHRNLGFAARKTMSVAQQLYEGIDIGSEGTVGLITYMRTDSVKIADLARKQADEFIISKYGEAYRGGGRVYKSSAQAQEAHEAIRPTSVFRTPDEMKRFLSRDQLRLYQLIWRRFLASQMASAVYENTTVNVKSGNYLFRATDSKIKFPGYLEVYGVEDAKNEEIQNEQEYGNEAKSKPRKTLPELQPGEELKVHDYLPKQHFTQPPPPYTEATLIKALEEKGIGRPSTYAPTVDTIQRRGYVELKEKKFRPTELGFSVTQMLEEFFPNIIDVDFTADMEEKLDKVEEGEAEWKSVIDTFYRPFSKTLEDADKKIPKIEAKPEPTGEMCEKCGKPLVKKRGRFGEFIACSGYPECRNTKPILKEIGVACPMEDCNGQIIEKRSRKGKFFGCSNYPNCKFASWDMPLNEKCEICGKIKVLHFTKNRKSYKTCIDPQCKKK